MKSFYLLTLSFAPLIYLLLAASCSVFITYPVYSLTDGLFPLSKIVNRGALLLLIIGIYPAMVRMNLTWVNFGFCGINKAFFKRFTLGFGIGILILGFVVIFLLAFGTRVIDWEKAAIFSIIISSLSKALLVGVLVALVEEPLFRGLLLSSLLTHSSKTFAISIGAFYYAMLHFLRSDLIFVDSEISWASGFLVILDSFSNLLRLQNVDSFLALFLAGVFLGLIRLHYKCSLSYCIGLHAGWVFVIKATKALTNGNRKSPWANLASDYDGIIGYFAAGWLMLLIIGFLIFLQFNRLKNTNR